MASLQHTNSVPMIWVFKSVATIITAFGDCVIYGAPVELLVIVALIVMLAGAVIAARNEVEVTHVCLFWMLVNCVFTSGYVLYLKYVTKNVRLSKFDMVFYNNVLNSLFLFPVSVMNGEFKTFMSTPVLHSVGYAVKNGLAGFVGFFLNLSSLNCIAQTGPTTYAVIGSLNKVPIALMGYYIFDAKISEETRTFISISLLGGILYIVAKLRPLNLPVGMNDLIGYPRLV